MNIVRLTRFSIFGILAFLCIFSAAGSGKKDKSTPGEKARYYFRLGAVSEALEQTDKAYEFYKKAMKEDPSFSDASFAYGALRMTLDADTFASREELLRNLSYMRPHITAYPEDVTAGEAYAYYAGLADTIPEAEKVYENLVKAHPGMSSLYIPQSYFYMTSGKTEKAVQAMREYERLEGATSETLIRKISYYVSAGDTLSALKELNEYVKNNPGEPEPLIHKSLIYNVLNMPDSALYTLEEALKDFPHNGEMKYDIAMMYQEKGDTTRFHQLIAEAFKEESTEYEERMDILRGYTRALPVASGPYDESDKLFEYAAGLYPSDPLFLELYADYEMVKGNIDASYANIKKAFSLEPENLNLLGRFMSFSIVTDRPREGMKAYEDFQDAEDKMQYNIALTYVSAAQLAGENDKALAWADTLLRNTIPDLTLADTVTEAQVAQMEEKGMMYETYIGSVIYEVAGDLYAKMGNQKEAVREYENSIALNDWNNASALNNYAYYMVETLKAAPGSEEFKKAKEMSYKALEQTEQNPNGNYFDTYAWILFKEGNYKDALEYMEMAMEAAGSDINEEFYSHYGDILYMNGKVEEAIEQWKKGLEMEPDNKLLKKKVESKTIIDE